MEDTMKQEGSFPSSKRLKTLSDTLIEEPTESPVAGSDASTHIARFEECLNSSEAGSSRMGQALTSISSYSDSKSSSRELTLNTEESMINTDDAAHCSTSPILPLIETPKTTKETAATPIVKSNDIESSNVHSELPPTVGALDSGDAPIADCQYKEASYWEANGNPDILAPSKNEAASVTMVPHLQQHTSLQIVETPSEITEVMNSKYTSSFKLEETSEQFGLVNYHCDICSKDITLLCRIRCAECEDFDLCIDCFCKGAESADGDKKQHKNYHKYIPIGRSSFPLYKSDWSADEEVMLLEGVSKFGLGNWNEVADLVNSVATRMKKSHMCERHYFDTYLNSRTSPLPDPEKLLTSSDGGPLSLEVDIDSAEDEKSNCSVTKTSGRSNFTKPSHQVVGYWPLRGDFDVEYDNDAELILADMEFKDEEAAQERLLKLQIIEIYNSKLDERMYRKKTVIERGLLDIKALQQKEKKRTKEERELHNLFRPLARFHSEEEHERFIQVLIEERHIRSRLQKLQEWKSLDLRTIEEVKIYEEEKKRREDMKHRGIMFPYLLDNSQKSKRRSRFGGKVEEQIDTKNKLGPHSASPQSIQQYPGAALLDENEHAFCEGIGLPPAFYLLAKKILLHEAASNEHFSKEDFTKTLKIDATRSGELYDFFLNLDFNFASRQQVAMLSNPEYQTTPNMAQHPSQGFKMCSSLQPHFPPPNSRSPASPGMQIENNMYGTFSRESIKTEGDELLNL